MCVCVCVCVCVCCVVLCCVVLCCVVLCIYRYCFLGDNGRLHCLRFCFVKCMLMGVLGFVFVLFVF